MHFAFLITFFLHLPFFLITEFKNEVDSMDGHRREYYALLGKVSHRKINTM